MLAYCGLMCTECPGYLATQKDDDAGRERVAALWSKQHHTTFTPEDINCDGCLSEGGRLLRHCQICEIRKCAKEKTVVNCAYCGEYACETLTRYFALAPIMKENLEKTRAILRKAN
jgi:hypothetical protein